MSSRTSGSATRLNTAVKLLVLVLVVIWLALVYFTFADARRRIDDPLLVGCATAASLFPFVGTIVYMIVRPPEYLEDVRERELEMQAAEARLHSLDYHLCPHCDTEVEQDFLRCPPACASSRTRAATARKPLDPDWRICPYCEAEIPGVTPAPRRRRRRRSEDASASPTRPRRSSAPEQLAHTPKEITQMDRTLILVKPDAFARGLTGEIIARFERKGLRSSPSSTCTSPRTSPSSTTPSTTSKPFFGELVDFITSGPLVAMVLEGHEAVNAARQVIGATNPLEAATGSIRGDFALEVGQNMVHGSDSDESAAREAAHLLPRARGRCSPARSSSPAARRSGSAILEQLGVAVRGRARPTSSELRTRATPVAVAGENALRKAIAAGADGATSVVLGRRHARRARRRDLRQAADRGGRARDAASASAGARTRSSAASRCCAPTAASRAAPASAREVTFRTLDGADARLVRRDRRVARARRRLRDPGPRRRARRAHRRRLPQRRRPAGGGAARPRARPAACAA